MNKVIRFKRYLRAEVVEGDGVYLIAERFGHVRLAGGLMERATPLLAGKHTRAEVVDALAGEFPAARVEAVLDKLVAAGHVVEVDAGADQRAGGFWELHSLDGDAALARVAATPIDVVRFGDVSDEGFAEAAEQAGLTLGSGPSALTVVLVDD
ncbi:MAG TPA: goadsporin biosynthetic protein, partial [Amycolatopsis sp.]